MHGGSAIDLLVLIPAAGHATRLQPLVGSKEMISVQGRPLIDYLAERLLAANPARIRVITRPDKADLLTYVADRGWEIVLGTPPHVAASLLLGLDGVPDDSIALVGFPDTLIEDPEAAVRTLAPVAAGDVDVSLGLFHTPEPWRGDVVNLGADGLVRHVEAKPTDPVDDLVWGLVAARVGAMRALKEVSEPGDLWNRLASQRRVAGVVLPGHYLDLGTPTSLAPWQE